MEDLRAPLGYAMCVKQPAKISVVKKPIHYELSERPIMGIMDKAKDIVWEFDSIECRCRMELGSFIRHRI